jgi:hypothetical protein
MVSPAISGSFDSWDFPKTGLTDMSLHISMVENSNPRVKGSD